MEHWFDRMARDVAGQRLSRRQVIVTGARAMAASAVAGTVFASFSKGRLPGCQLQTIPPECTALSQQVEATSLAACGTEASYAQAYCRQETSLAANLAFAKCLQKANPGACGPCQICVQNACVPLCTHCKVCDPASNTCRDTCRETSPCSGCLGDTCQPLCPKGEYCDSKGKCQRCDFEECRHIDSDGVCRGCDSECERCEHNTCVSLCAADELCCGGSCIQWCGGFCDSATGVPKFGRLCPNTEDCCSGECVELTHDPNHCGSCATHCPASAPICENGQCRHCKSDFDCNKGFVGSLTCCPDGCVNLKTDNQNCGACGHACLSGQDCCTGKCTDIKTDHNNCGACASPCASNETCCSGKCANLQSDPKNCGSCGNVCPIGTCVHGQCSGCPQGQTPCGTSPFGQQCCTADEFCCGSGPNAPCCANGMACCTYTIPGQPTVTGCYDPTVAQCCPMAGGCPIGWQCCSAGGCCGAPGCCP